MRILRKPHPVAMFCAWFLTVFLVLFPKGGVKLGGLPLTWGYLFLAATVPPLFLLRLLVTPLRLPRTVLLALLALFPMQALTIYAGVFYGVSNPPYTVSTFVGLFALPWIFLLIYPPFLRYVDGDRLSRYLRLSILFAALWGIFLFFWHPFTGHYIEIPYLTVNAEDFGELENTKHIARGFFFKLISTYNNGNLYGVATLLLLPLYNVLEPRLWRRVILRIALVLTLSRSVWVGLVLEQTFSLVVILWRQLGTFPRIMVGTATRRLLAVGITIGLVFSALLFNSSSLSFLFDPTAGGRSSVFYEIFGSTFLPSRPLYGFNEILYISAIAYWGYAGLIALVLIFFSPLLLLAYDSTALDSPTRRAALKGLVLYIFLAAMDGAFNFIPVMAFYWFIYMIYIFGWPRPHAAEAPQPPRSPRPPRPLLPDSHLPPPSHCHPPSSLA